MNILNCDICGTSYPDTEEKCPTCGYSRAFDEETMNQPTVRAPHERVRGGRYSKKNVEKRKKLLLEQENAASGEDAVTEKIEAPVPVVEEPVEESVPVVEEPVAEPVPVAEDPKAEPVPVVEDPKAEPAPAEEEPKAEKPAKVKKEKPPKEVRRRRRRLNFALFVSVLVFVGSLGYLAMHFGLIDVQTLTAWVPAEITEFFDNQPEADVIPTEPATEESTDAATEETEETQPGSLRLNYSELTFDAVDQAVQLYCEGYTGGEITWSSDNDSVATVSGSGNVVAVGSGTTFVWATYGDQSVKCVVSCKF